MALDDVEPAAARHELAGRDGDPRQLEVILRETARIVRSRPPLVIAETRHGFVCAVQASTPRTLPAPVSGTAPGRSRRLRPPPPRSPRRALRGVGWRDRQRLIRPSLAPGDDDVALGVAGVAPLRDLRGRRDAAGYELPRRRSPSPTRSPPLRSSFSARRTVCPPRSSAASTSAVTAAAPTSSCRPSETSFGRHFWRPRRRPRSGRL